MRNIKISLKYIKDYIGLGYAEDITNYNSDEMNNFLNHSLMVSLISVGTYGVNGCIVQDYDTGDEFAVVKRNSNLLQLV